VPKTGEEVCGDSYEVTAARGVLTLTVADGLGHGPGAREAASAVTETVQRHAAEGLVPLLERVHAATRHTRGAAASIARVQRSAAVVQFAGVGNVAGAVCLGGTRRLMVSSNGTLGHLARSFREYQYPWAHQGVLVLHTDGLLSQWDLSGYPGLLTRHPAVVAAVLYRDFSRQRDDVTVVVAREAP
jgi:hypothetical protein